MSRRKLLCAALVICSAVFCETSVILDFFRRRAAGASPISAAAPTTTASYSRAGRPSVNVRSAEASSSSSGSLDEYPAQEDYQYTEYTSSQETPTEHSIVDGRGGGWGWGDAGHHQSNMDMYSLLGGLSFASLLGAALLYLSRRQQQSTMVMMTNGSGRRRRRDLYDDDLDEDESVRGESLAEFLGKLGAKLDSPWWNNEKTDKRNIVPFKLI